MVIYWIDPGYNPSNLWLRSWTPLDLITINYMIKNMKISSKPTKYWMKKIKKQIKKIQQKLNVEVWNLREKNTGNVHEIGL